MLVAVLLPAFGGAPSFRFPARPLVGVAACIGEVGVAFVGFHVGGFVAP